MITEVNEALNALMDQAAGQLREGSFEAAIEAFSACLVMSPHEAKAYQGRGLAHLQLKEWESAIQDFTKAREFDSSDLENWIGLAMGLAGLEKVYEAIDVLNDLLDKHPQYVRGHIQLGLLYYKLCITAKGRKHMEVALACRPTITERRLIEKTLKEEKILDAKRYYRPDFEELRRQNAGALSFGWLTKIGRSLTRLFKR